MSFPDKKQSLVLISLGQGLHFDLLWKCAPYLGERQMAECLKAYLENGSRLTYSQIQKISPYLSEKDKDEMEGWTVQP